MRSKTKTNWDLPALVFPGLVPVILVFVLSYDWFITLFMFVLIGKSNYFGFGFKILNKLLKTALYSVHVDNQ